MKRSLFPRRFSRRLMLLFVGCALGPVGVLSVLVFTHTAAQLERQSQARLHQGSKSIGMAIFERLALLEEEAQLAAERFERVGATSEDTRAHFDGLAIVEADGRVTPFLGDVPTAPALDDYARRHLAAGQGLLFAGDERGAPIVIVAPLGDAADGRRVLAALDRDHVVVPAALQTDGVVSEYCVLGPAGGVIACSFVPDAGELAALRGAEPGAVEFEHRGEAYLADHWALFLKARFAAPPWDVVLAEPRSAVMEPLNDFARTLAMVAVASMLGVMLLSGAQIRRGLVPLHRLRAGARRIAGSDFDSRVEVDSGDEFQEVAEAFNRMAETLGQQFQAIRELNRTLEDKVRARTAELSAALAELRETQARLVHREKMASVGQLVAGVAHEINNPLNFVQGNMKFLGGHREALAAALADYEAALAAGSEAQAAELARIRERHDLDFVVEDLAAIVDACREGVERTTAIVANLQSFSRLDGGDARLADLHELIDSTLAILAGRLGPIEVVREYGDIPKVECLAGQISQVLMNLVVNAADAVGDSGRITIRTLAPDADTVRFEVEDDGCGIEDAVRDRIFDPFFTTKDVGQGTGLGLAITFGVVSRHGGRIQLESEPGHGTCFRVDLPIKYLPPSVDESDGSVAAISGPGGR